MPKAEDIAPLSIPQDKWRHGTIQDRIMNAVVAATANDQDKTPQKEEEEQEQTKESFICEGVVGAQGGDAAEEPPRSARPSPPEEADAHRNPTVVVVDVEVVGGGETETEKKTAKRSREEREKAEAPPAASAKPQQLRTRHRRHNRHIVTTTLSGAAQGVVPHCPESAGEPRYRNAAGYCCTYCTYTVCTSCYREIPFPRRENSDDETSEDEDGEGRPDSPWETLEQVLAASPGDQHGERGRSPRTCHLCGQGQLAYGTALLLPWSCQGPLPQDRLRRGQGGAYDLAVLPRYHTLRAQQAARATSTLPLIAAFHGVIAGGSSDSSSGSGAPVLQPLPHRAPCCPEGGSFVFSVLNPRLEELCVWCAVDLDARQGPPWLAGDATAVPLLPWRCPPTLPEVAPRRYTVRLPPGTYGQHHVHALALYMLGDIFQRVSTQLTAPGGERGGLSAVKVMPTVEPLLVVRVLHRLPCPARSLADLRRGEPEVSSRARANSCRGDVTAAQEEDGAEELALCLDYLLQGRSVAVYGAASKYFFLEHVSHSAALLSRRLCVLDVSKGRASTSDRAQETETAAAEKPRGTGLSPLARLLHRLHRSMLSDRAEAGDCHRNGGLVDRAEEKRSTATAEPEVAGRVSAAFEGGRSPSLPRDVAPPAGLRAAPPCTPPLQPAEVICVDEEEGEETHDQNNNNSATQLCDVSNNNSATQLFSPPPLARTPSGCELDAPPDEDCALLPLTALADGKKKLVCSSLDLVLPLLQPTRKANEDGEDEEEGTTSLEQQVADAPLLTVRSPTVRFASAAVRDAVLRQLQPPRRCVEWLALPSLVAQRTLQESAAGAPVLLPQARRVTLLVVHNIDLLDSDATAALVQLCRAHGSSELQLLCSYDHPQWPLSAAAAALAGQHLVHLQLRHLLRPRTHEMRRYDALRVLAAYEAGAHGRSLKTGGTLPMQDTIRRILFSLPAAFADLLLALLEAQEEAGEGQYISLHTLAQKFEERGLLVSQGRMKALQRELTSNRLAEYDVAEHALLVPQYQKVKKILLEVTAQRLAGEEAKGLAEMAA